MSAHWLNVSDVDIHQKFSILKNSKYTNFDIAMNVFLLVVCSPIFGCMSEAVCGESLGPESEWERRNEKSKKGSWFQRCGIYRFPSHVIDFKCKIYFCVRQVPLGFQMCWRFCPIRFLELLNLFWHLTIFVLWTSFFTSEFWILFFQNFLLHVHFADWFKIIGV